VDWIAQASPLLQLLGTSVEFLGACLMANAYLDVFDGAVEKTRALWRLLWRTSAASGMLEKLQEAGYTHERIRLTVRGLALVALGFALQFLATALELLPSLLQPEAVAPH